MPYRIIILLLSLLIILNLIIGALGLIMGVNPYKKYGRELTIGFGVLILIFVTIYIILPIIGVINFN